MEERYVSGEHRSPKKPGQKKSYTFIWVAVAAIVVGLGIFGVMKLLSSTDTTTPNPSLAPGTPPGGAGNGNGQQSSRAGGDLSDSIILGKITALSSTSITIQPKPASSSPRTFTITSSTQKMTPSGSTTFNKSDVKVGDTVGVDSANGKTADAIVLNSGTANDQE